MEKGVTLGRMTQDFCRSNLSICEKRTVPDFEDSLVSLGFKFFKARSAFSPNPAEWKSGLDEETVHLLLIKSNIV